MDTQILSHSFCERRILGTGIQESRSFTNRQPSGLPKTNINDEAHRKHLTSRDVLCILRDDINAPGILNGTRSNPALRLASSEQNTDAARILHKSISLEKENLGSLYGVLTVLAGGAF